MGKKRKHLAPQSGRHPSKKSRYQHPDAPRPKQHKLSEAHSHSKPQKKSKNTPNPQHQRPVIPFASHHNILLVGEGDLSFAASLVYHHKCSWLRAGVFEKGKEELLAKYPHVGKNVEVVEEGGGNIIFGLDATKMAPFLVPRVRKRNKDKNTFPKADGRKEPVGDLEDDERDDLNTDNNARKQSTVRKSPGSGLLDRIIFNFPHVGGKSTDVNRQVRANQSLLIQFFERAIPSLALGGRIIVTLFEGEPYSLWNIRDLGRHAGLVVERSFVFQASAYPGYKHARTLGVVRKGGKKGYKNTLSGSTDGGGGGSAKKYAKESHIDDGEEAVGEQEEEEEEEDYEAAGDEKGEEDEDEEDEKWEESTTAWRGEERPARSYVFIRKDDEMAPKTELDGSKKVEKEYSSDEGED